MDYYDLFGNRLTEVFNLHGERLGDSESYTTYAEAVRYAYSDMGRAKGIPFVVYADNHGYWRNGRYSFFENLGNIADWSDMYMLDLGDSCNIISWTDYQNQTSDPLQHIDDAMTLANVPETHRLKIFGNHDMWFKNADNVTCALSDHSWLLTKYFRNSGAIHYYDNDFAQNVGDFSFMSIGGWDFDRDSGSSLGGYSHYVINGEHMESIINMLAMTEGDIVVMSHVQPNKNAIYSRYYNIENDGVGAIAEYTESSFNNSSNNIAQEVDIGYLLNARDKHLSGSINDSYGVQHQFDFTMCDGNVLCTLSGHSHADWLNYEKESKILSYIFDCNYQAPYGTYFCKIDKDAMLLRVWKVDTVPTVYAYQIPLRYGNYSTL